MMELALSALMTSFWCMAFYQLGRRYERRRWRNESGWWQGYREGIEQATRAILGGRFTVEVHETQKFKAN